MTNFAQIADEHAGLLQKVSEYDHAPSELRETEDLLVALEDDLQAREARLDQLRKRRKSEHKDIDKLQRSSTRRFITRLKEGKDGLDKKLEKEEREYMEAAQDEHNENRTVQELKATVQASREKVAELKENIVARKEMLKRLDEIYKSAFDGPSPDFPEEDDAEQEVQHAEQHYDEVQARLNHEKNAFGILDRAAFYANEAHTAIQSANRHATYETFLGGGLWAQMAESDDLLRTQGCANMSVNLIKRAHRAQPLVKEVDCGTIANPDWIHSVFDNLYTDFMFQKKIEQSVRTIAAFQRGVFQECSKSEARVKSLDREAKDAHEFLRSRRRQLAATRREILRRVKEDGGIRVIGVTPDGPGPDLPSYMRQAEEGTRVLARGVERAPSTDDAAPPPEYSEPQASPSPPQRTLHEGDAMASSPVSETQQTPTQSFPPDAKTRPEGSTSGSPLMTVNAEPSRMPSMPVVGTPSGQAGPSSDGYLAFPVQSPPPISTSRSIDSDDIPLSQYVTLAGSLPDNTSVETPTRRLTGALNSSEVPSTSRGRYVPPPGPPPGHVARGEPPLPPLPNEGPSARRIPVQQTSSHSPSPQRPASSRSISHSPLPSPQIEVSRTAEPDALPGYEPRPSPRYAPPPGPPPGHVASTRSPSRNAAECLPLGAQPPFRHGSTLSVSTSSTSPYPRLQRPSSASASASGSSAASFNAPNHRPTTSTSSAFPQPYSSSPTRTASTAGPGPIGWAWENAGNSNFQTPEGNVSESIRRLSIAPGPGQQRARSASPSYSSSQSNSRPPATHSHQHKPSFASNNPYRLFTEA